MALDRTGTALALVTESLGTDRTVVETGYTSLLSIAPAVDLAASAYGFSVHGGSPGRYTDMLIGMRFSKPSTASLSSYIYDADIFVYDDDRDVFIELTCDDEHVYRAAAAAFHSIVPIRLHEGAPEPGFHTPIDNPPSSDLVAAAETARDVLVAAGYAEMAVQRSEWQLRVHGEPDPGPSP